MTTDVVAVVDVDHDTAAWVATVTSLRRAHLGIPVLVVGAAGAQQAPLAEAGAVPTAGTLSSVVDEAWRERHRHVLVVTGPAFFPPVALGPALVIVGDDIRTGTVSFLSNAAHFLTLAPVDEPGAAIGDLDEQTITSLLRSASPEAVPAPSPFAAGPAVLLSAYALSAVGPLAEPGDSHGGELVLAEFSLRARARGFLDVLDPSTYLRRPAPPEAGGVFAGHPSSDEGDDLVRELAGADSPLDVGKAVARAKVWGLRILIDGSCLGPLEMGTQVQAVALIRALARRPDVARVTVALSGPLPSYAENLLGDPKVEAHHAPGGDLSGLASVDVAHQPFQPEGPIDIWASADVAARSVVTILDLIAYRTRSYQVTGTDWEAYRRRVRRSAALVDGIVAPARDVARQIALEAMTVPDRVYTVPLGTDHLGGGETGTAPAGLTTDGAFLLVLGADYTHKNRDLAIRTAQVLRARGLPLSLVLAGARVYGSSRSEEAVACSDDDQVVVLDDVTSEERNWLLRHAALVLYPSSAEGFGLVPFEAARFGTPTVLVPFGPLRETFGGLPVLAADWSPAALADAAEACLRDPSVAGAQVRAALDAGARYTWDACAAGLVEVYRAVLARPGVRMGTELTEAGHRIDLLTVEHERAMAELDRLRASPEARVGSRFRAARDVLEGVRARLAPGRREP